MSEPHDRGSARDHQLGPSETAADEVPGSETASDEVPETGLPAVDQAIAGLVGLDLRPVSEHHEALAAVHETLHRELQPPSGGGEH